MPAPKPLSISTTDWFLLVILSLLWGAAFFFGKVAVAEVPPLTLALARVGLALPFLAPVFLIWGLPARQDYGAFAFMGFMNNVMPFSLIFWGQMHIPSGLVSILIATSPMFSVGLAHFLTSDDKLTPTRAIGLVAGLTGVVITIGPDLLDELGAHVAAQLACLLAAFCYAVSAIYSRRFRHDPPLTVAAGQLAASTLFLIPIVALLDRPWTLPMPSIPVIGAMLGIAILSTALAYMIYFRLIARAGATNALLVTFMVPVSAILLGTLILDERLAPRHFVGMLWIVIGLLALDGRLGRFVARSIRMRSAGP